MTQVDDSMEKDKYIVLLMDEMKIQADLVYDKHTGKIIILCKHALCMAAKIGALIGFTNIGEVNNHLNDFERSLKDNPVTPLATSMLVIMIRDCSATSVSHMLSFLVLSYQVIIFTIFSGKLLGDWNCVASE